MTKTESGLFSSELRFSNRFSLPVAWIGKERKDWKYIVYRLYTETDELLYVGMTTNLLSRMRSHRSKHGKDWWDFVDYIVTESCETLYAAQAKEILAIAQEMPEHNRTFN